EEIDVASEIAYSVSVITPLATLKDVTIKTKIDLPPTIIQSEKRKFQQCLMNIFKNAIEAMPDGGTLTVMTAIENQKLKI
ncbi:hypothetical protein R0K18_35270, partial [Pantoea sp. SIMBA_133]